MEKNICEEMFYLMNLALDGEISEFEQKQLDDHLASCPHCTQLWEELCQMQIGVQSLEEEPSEGFAGRVLEQIRLETETPKIVPFRQKLIRYGSLAACAALCIGLYQSGIFEMSSDTSSMSMSITTTTTTAMSTSTALPESTTEYVIEDRAVAEIDESYESIAELESDVEVQNFSVTTTTVTTADTAAGLTLPEQVAVLLQVDEVHSIMIDRYEIPDVLPEGVEGGIVSAGNWSYFLVDPEYWDDVRVQFNFGVSTEAVEDGIPCVVIIMPE